MYPNCDPPTSRRLILEVPGKPTHTPATWDSATFQQGAGGRGLQSEVRGLKSLGLGVWGLGFRDRVSNFDCEAQGTKDPSLDGLLPYGKRPAAPATKPGDGVPCQVADVAERILPEDLQHLAINPKTPQPKLLNSKLPNSPNP